MTLPLTVDPPPLTTGSDDVVRIGGTRVTLDTVVQAFREGLTPEEIQQQYPSLELAHVYSVIAYYLHHRTEVEEYLEGMARRRESVRREVEARFDEETDLRPQDRWQELGERLLVLDLEDRELWGERMDDSPLTHLRRSFA